MKALGWSPSIAHCEKCGAPAAFQKVLGPLAEGTQTTGWTAPSSDPLQKSLLATWTPKLGNTGDLQTFMAEYSAAKVVTDALAAAGSTDPAKLNAAIGKTNTMEPFGQKVTFGSDHTAPVLATTVQWQGNSLLEVYPTGNGSTALQFPAQGLK